MIAELFYMTTDIWAKTPYNKDFVTSLKEVIPKEHRRWDPEEKVWAISYIYEDQLFALCSTYFSDVVQYGEKRYIKAIASSPAYETLFLLPTAPKEVVVAVYRVLSKLYHPDVNKAPDADEKMKRINIAKDEIMGRR